MDDENCLSQAIELLKECYDLLPLEETVLRERVLNLVCPIQEPTAEDIAWAEEALLKVLPREERHE